MAVRFNRKVKLKDTDPDWLLNKTREWRRLPISEKHQRLEEIEQGSYWNRIAEGRENGGV
jgi:hypothetical protein